MDARYIKGGNVVVRFNGSYSQTMPITPGGVISLLGTSIEILDILLDDEKYMEVLQGYQDAMHKLAYAHRDLAEVTRNWRVQRDRIEELESQLKELKAKKGRRTIIRRVLD